MASEQTMTPVQKKITDLYWRAEQLVDRLDAAGVHADWIAVIAWAKCVSSAISESGHSRPPSTVIHDALIDSDCFESCKCWFEDMPECDMPPSLKRLFK